MLCDVNQGRRAEGVAVVGGRWFPLALSILNRPVSQSVRKEGDMLWQPAACSAKQSPVAVERRDEQYGRCTMCVYLAELVCVTGVCLSLLKACLVYVLVCACICVTVHL